VNNALILDGKATAEAIRNQLKAEVGELSARGIQPGLAVILVGEDPGSVSYVRGKEQDCIEVGMRDFFHRFPADHPEAGLLDLIGRLNVDPAVHGILVQLPLPRHINERKVIEAINPDKDVDGFHPVNVGRMLLGQDCFLPCTPHGVIKMLEIWKIPTQGKHVVICGRSNIVGKPMVALLLQKGLYGDATVTVCHSKTPDLARYTRDADILIAAMGQPELIKADMVKPGAVVIDVGVNRLPDPSRKSGSRLVGDVDFAAVSQKAGAITPVPGGVGLMTRAMLMVNTVQSARRVLAARG
jgi:methylenetetrahydrofolate dehydrogenase (NADP+)/methenyltetrahydrofolate cyclohydrolase